MSNSNKQVHFLDGTLKPLEAKQVMLKVLDDQINYYKLQNLSCWMKDNTCNPYESKIKELNQNKNELRRIINEAQTEGCNLSLHGDFKVALAK